MSETINDFIFANTFTATLSRILLILIATWLGSIIGSWLFVKMLRARSRTWHDVAAKRLVTLEALGRSAVKAGVYVAGFIGLLLNLGVPGSSIVTAMALFSAGFGFAARPIISDYLTGIIFIFEDQFAVGDKVEMLEVVGVVEAVDLRTCHIRSTTGELYIVPNGDVRVVRNLSRGLFSIATIKVTVPATDLERAMQVLETVADTALDKLQSLTQRPEIFSEEGAISSHVELILSAKATYGLGARARTRLMALVTDAFKEANIQIIN